MKRVSRSRYRVQKTIRKSSRVLRETPGGQGVGVEGRGKGQGQEESGRVLMLGDSAWFAENA